MGIFFHYFLRKPKTVYRYWWNIGQKWHIYVKYAKYEMGSVHFMICVLEGLQFWKKKFLDTQKLFETTSVVLHISQLLPNQRAKNEKKVQ